MHSSELSGPVTDPLFSPVRVKADAANVTRVKSQLRPIGSREQFRSLLTMVDVRDFLNRCYKVGICLLGHVG